MSLNDKEYFEYQIKGLILILQQGNKEDQAGRSYVIEKLNMILNGGIGFHPLIEEKLKDE